MQEPKSHDPSLDFLSHTSETNWTSNMITKKYVTYEMELLWLLY